MAPAGADRFQRRLDIGESLHALGVEIVADDLAVLVDADLPRDENEFRRLHAGEMRVLPERLAERVGIENLDVGHRQTLFRARRGIAVAANLIPPARRSP